MDSVFVCASYCHIGRTGFSDFFTDLEVEGRDVMLIKKNKKTLHSKKKTIIFAGHFQWFS